MDILLTGAGGFVGGRLAEILNNMDDVRVVLLTTHMINGYRCVEHKGYNFSPLDLLMDDIDHFDVVIHAGAYAPKVAGSEDVAMNFASLRNTQYLLTHLPNIPRKIIYLSSATVYRDFSSGAYSPDGGVITEDTIPSPENQYGLIKYSSELLVRDWANGKGVFCDILRLSSIYGVGDIRRQMLMVMLEKAARGEDLELWCAPGMVRNQLYVDDCCRFIVNAVSNNDALGVVNLASAENCTMEDMVKGIVAATNNNIRYRRIGSKLTQGKDMRISAEKRLTLLGEEEYTLMQGIQKTYVWIKHHIDGMQSRCSGRRKDLMSAIRIY